MCITGMMNRMNKDTHLIVLMLYKFFLSQPQQQQNPLYSYNIWTYIGSTAVRCLKRTCAQLIIGGVEESARTLGVLDVDG